MKGTTSASFHCVAAVKYYFSYMTRYACLFVQCDLDLGCYIIVLGLQ